MTSVGEQIREARKQKGLTQEQLAQKVDRNLRTIQRIENSENNPNGDTLNIICEVLEIDLVKNTKAEKSAKTSRSINLFIMVFFLIILNVVLALLVGFTNLRALTTPIGNLAGLLLSFFIPHFIVIRTKDMSGAERFFKFGSGYLLYFTAMVVSIFFKEKPWDAFLEILINGFLVCLILAMSILYYGKQLLKIME